MLLIFLFKLKITKAAIKGIMVKIKKKPDIPVFAEIPSICSANVAANLPANPVNTYQIPNKKANILAGASLLTYDNPTGDIDNSPIVCNKYARINQIMLTEAVSAPFGMASEPNANIPKPEANKVNPIANF